MDYIKKKLLEKGLQERAVVKRLISEFGNVVVEDVSIDQILTGMKGMTSLLTVTSKLDPENGIRYRGYLYRSCMNYCLKLIRKGNLYLKGYFI